MSVQKEGVRINYICDGCGQVRIDQDGVRARWRPYKAAWADAQADGWTAKKKPDVSDWQHFCPQCPRETDKRPGGHL